MRRIRTGDFARLVEILNASFQKEILIIGLDSNRLTSFQKYHRIIEVLYHIFDFFRRDYPTILVAIIDNRVVGEVHLTPIGKHIWTIDSLATDPAYGRRGVGYSLISSSVKFISKRRGKKALSSIRTDNTSALRIADRLGFMPLQKTTLFFHEVEKPPSEDIHKNFSIRRFKSSDSKDAFDACLFTDPPAARTRFLSPEDFSTSLLQTLQHRLQRVKVEKLILEEKGKIIGYANFSYTSPNEAATIENFCVRRDSGFQQAAGMFLAHILRFLAARRIRKILIKVSENRHEAIVAIEKKGFRHLASFQEIAKDLDKHE